MHSARPRSAPARRRAQRQLEASVRLSAVSTCGDNVVSPMAGGVNAAIALTSAFTRVLVKVLPSLAVMRSTCRELPLYQSAIVTLSAVPITLITRSLPVCWNHSSRDVASHSALRLRAPRAEKARRAAARVCRAPRQSAPACACGHPAAPGASSLGTRTGPARASHPARHSRVHRCAHGASRGCRT